MTAATTDLYESNGAGPTVTGALSNVNMGSQEAYNIVVATYPITAGNNSYEKWHRIGCSAAGTSTALANFRVYASTGFSANCTHKTNCRTTSYGGAQTYRTPVATDDSGSKGYTQTMPTSDPGGTGNLGYGGTLGASMDITSGLTKYTDYCITQCQTTASANVGASGITMTYKYDETG